MSPPSQELLSHLFQTPLPPPTHSPVRAFGVTSQSTDVLLKLLKENHEGFHIFFNERGMHNHVAHHLLAAYALGGTGRVIEAAYGVTGSKQLSAFASPIKITDNNFFDHLGIEANYNAYLNFFSTVLSEKDVDVGEILEEYIFSERFNFDKDRKEAGKPQPEMLNRFLAGLLHPMIHTGYAVEFGLKGILVEGLAQTAVHKTETSLLVPESFFDFSGPAGSGVSHLTSMLPKVRLQQPAVVSKESGHIFSIMARMLEDARLDPQTLDLKGKDNGERFLHARTHCGNIIREYAEQWDIRLTGDSSSDASALDAKVEELFWAHTLMYGVGGWTEEKGLRADFFSMHFVTTAIFLSNFVAILKKTSSKVTFLRSYVSLCLAWWVSRGRPALSIAKFYDATGGFNADDAAQFAVPGAQPTPNEKALKSGDKLCLTPNAWYPILQSAITHPDEHICKLIRALAHAASLYGTRAAGHFAHLKSVVEINSDVNTNGGTPKFEGVEKLDGSLFVRVARLSMDRLGWMREGQEERKWDFEGFV